MTDAIEPVDPYQPISCARYSEYELFILQRRRLHLTWCADNVIHAQVVRPMDLYTRAGAEYLVVLGQDGVTHTVRLDRIRTLQPA